MHMFTLADGTEVTALEQWDGDAADGGLDTDTTKLSRLSMPHSVRIAGWQPVR